MNELIILKQAPIITYDKIKEVGEKVQKRIADLNLESQVITEHTKQSAKNTRADLNKEFKAFEERKKFIKESVLAPYNEFEANYKNFIAQHYQNADKVLKDKIDFFENQLKEEKAERVKAFFEELCQAEKIDFVTYERLGLNVTLSVTENQLRKQVEEFITKVVNDVDLINGIPESDEYKSEVLFEYKKSLDANHSLRIVKERQEAKQRELARIEAEKQVQAERQAKLQAEQEAKEKEVLQAPQEVKQVPSNQVSSEQNPNNELVETSFKVRGTMEQLKALKQFIISNNIEIL
ncbi:DUF1351 domain-containing protein [Capnocytophaga catalasegens]|uniref:DUF1351 domain-containing protein n=1 Tax=Capnocytophaga catalasegens TaxID=1004260 RepID=A0AAV5AW25_9FLAO|nr:DUF1351 domain-containing protein [Capnocytophaga catalasegens]GIZ15537.1 hypothetical protein RCZ03_15370 [Capnocytophaga catalasegens]GJM49880.1 hypothetical protein RCZ15_08550 [Capnocytophaga catalasegens]GJM54052.1 hypothetical protein RCZ16_23680 [Capnocytophaga catalasegens]